MDKSQFPDIFHKLLQGSQMGDNHVYNYSLRANARQQPD
jgi:hypothetical protein